jgi:steroid delta-isomerase-like uncharacterized protein
MSPEENKKLVLDHYEAFVHRHDDAAVRKQLAADFVDHEMPAGTPPGPEAALRWGQTLRTAFPDLRVKIEDIVAEGDLVAVRASWTGTHQGPFPPLSAEPTNRRAVLTGMVFWRVRDGQIVERWATLDRLGLMQQLGAKA